MTGVLVMFIVGEAHVSKYKAMKAEIKPHAFLI
jgi:hypothetical protein